MQFPFSYIQNNPTNGLVGWWRLNEGLGSNIRDSSPNNFTGVLVNSPTWVKGKFYRNALSLNSANSESVTIGTGTYPILCTTPITYSAWINTNGAASNILTIIGGASQQHLQFRLTPPGNLQLVSENLGNIGQSTFLISDNIWYHVAASYDILSNYEFYVNGILTNNGNNNVGLLPSQTLIGKNGQDPEYFNGYLNDVRIYNRILLPQEILAIAEWRGAF